MPVRKEYTAEFKEQAVRFAFEEIGPDESRSAAVERLGPKLNVRPATLMNWVKAAAPATRRSPAAGSVEELRAQNAALRKENRELARANAILQDAAAFSGRRSTAKRGSAFVAAHRDYGVVPICRVLQVARRRCARRCRGRCAPAG